MPAPIIIYHANCLDGSAAALVMREALSYGTWAETDILALPMHYGDSVEVEVFDGREVYIVDFSFDIETTLAIATKASHVHILDHHQTSMERFKDGTLDCGNNVSFFMDSKRSGARLAWDYWYPETSPPWWVAHAEDRDLWRFTLPGTREICASLYMYVDDLDKLYDVIKEGYDWHYVIGSALQENDRRWVQKLLKDTHEVSIGGYAVPAINSGMLISELGNALLVGDTPFAAVYSRRGDEYQVSLRSDATREDVARIAQLYGGGGHRNAAGFRIPVKHEGMFCIDAIGEL